MKIMFNGGGYNELTKTLKELGHTVCHAPFFRLYNATDPIWKDYNKLLVQNIEHEKPDVYLCAKGYANGKYIFPETTKKIQKIVKASIYMSFDDPFFLPKFMSLGMHAGYDIALSCSSDKFEVYRSVGIEPYCFWPAWDTTIYNIPTVAEKDKIDFVFVGTPYYCTDIPRKDIVLWAIAQGWKTEIYGSTDWISNKVIKNYKGKPFIQGDTRLAAYYKGYWSNWLTLPSLFAKSKINFSNHVNKATMYLNDRVPLVMGVGGCLVMDLNPELDKVFTHNKELVFYKDWNTLKHRMKFFVANRHSREQIGKRAKEKILREHTYKHRAIQLIDIIQNFCNRRNVQL